MCFRVRVTMITAVEFTQQKAFLFTGNLVLEQ